MLGIIVTGYGMVWVQLKSSSTAKKVWDFLQDGIYVLGRR